MVYYMTEACTRDKGPTHPPGPTPWSPRPVMTVKNQVVSLGETASVQRHERITR